MSNLSDPRQSMIDRCVLKFLSAVSVLRPPRLDKMKMTTIYCCVHYKAHYPWCLLSPPPALLYNEPTGPLINNLFSKKQQFAFNMFVPFENGLCFGLCVSSLLHDKPEQMQACEMSTGLMQPSVYSFISLTDINPPLELLVAHPALAIQHPSIICSPAPSLLLLDSVSSQIIFHTETLFKLWVWYDIKSNKKL